MKHPISIIVAIFVAVSAYANNGEASAKPTFYKEVARIFQKNCQECHRPAGTNYGGMVAPMSLVDYDEARPWAKSIAKQVQAKKMPPWHASEVHNGQFKNERVLAPEEIATIARWVELGAPKGNPADAPAPKEFQNHGGWMIGEPDLVVPMPAPYVVSDDVDDLYTAFHVDLTPELLAEDAWITSFQCKPGSKIIHHFNCHLLYPDAEGKLPEFEGFPDTEKGEIAPQGAGQYLGGVSSGTDANMYPEGFGYLLKKGTRVTFDIHYHKEPGPGTAVTDLSEMGFKLSRTKPAREITSPGPLMNFAINIPAGDKHFQIGPVSQVFRKDSEIISLMPHMHLRGTEAKFELFYPDGRHEVVLHVPRYDFAWQTVYYYKEMKPVPAGTRIQYTAWYDNSAEMAVERKFDSTVNVTFGEKSTDEMMMGFVQSADVVKAAGTD